MIKRLNKLIFSGLFVLTVFSLVTPKLASAAYIVPTKTSKVTSLNSGYNVWHCGQTASAHVCLIYNSKTNLMYAKGAWLSGNSNDVSIGVTIYDDSAPWVESPQDITDAYCDDGGNNLCTNLWVWVPRVHIYKHNHRYHAEINVVGDNSSGGFHFIASTPSITIK